MKGKTHMQVVVLMVALATVVVNAALLSPQKVRNRAMRTAEMSQVPPEDTIFVEDFDDYSPLRWEADHFDDTRQAVVDDLDDSIQAMDFDPVYLQNLLLVGGGAEQPRVSDDANEELLQSMLSAFQMSPDDIVDEYRNSIDSISRTLQDISRMAENGASMETLYRYFSEALQLNMSEEQIKGMASIMEQLDALFPAA